MKKLLAVLAIAALSSVVARAEDKGTEFKFGGEVREQFTSDQNPNFTNSGAISESHWDMKNQFHINAVTSDKLQAYFNLIHYAIWGGGGAVPSNAGPFAANGANGGAVTGAGAVTANNTVQISEAWMWWKATDMFSLRAGRQTMDYGDGLVFSKNDWLLTPYNVDGIMGRFAWDFLDLDVGGGKFSDAGPNTALSPNTIDQETVFYGAYASFKNLPDFLKKGEVFILQVNADPAPTGAAANYGPFAPSMSGTSSWNLTNYGLHFKGDVSALDYRLDAVFQSGKQKGVGAASDTTFNGSMFDVELGYSFPEFMKGRVFANYHQDSGNDLTASNTNSQYQPLFYDQHTYGGLMDVFGWGNLTDIRFGLELQPGEDNWVGVQANLFSRTQGNGAYTSITSGNFGNYFTLPTVGGGAAAQAAAGKNLGTEIDVWAKHAYGHGFSILGQFGYLTLGNYYNNTQAGGTANPGNAWQFIANAKYQF